MLPKLLCHSTTTGVFRCARWQQCMYTRSFSLAGMERIPLAGITTTAINIRQSLVARNRNYNNNNPVAVYTPRTLSTNNNNGGDGGGPNISTSNRPSADNNRAVTKHVDGIQEPSTTSTSSTALSSTPSHSDTTSSSTENTQQQPLSPPPSSLSSTASTLSTTPTPTTTTPTAPYTAATTNISGNFKEDDYSPPPPIAPFSSSSSIDEASKTSWMPPLNESSVSNTIIGKNGFGNIGKNESVTPPPSSIGEASKISLAPPLSESSVSNIAEKGKESPIPSLSTSSTAETPKASPTVPPSSEPGTISGRGIVASYYDEALRLWSERSGISEIYELKKSVDAAGATYDLASADVVTNRRNLDDALRKWEILSGQHLQLLQRRESWTPQDAQRFADFVSLEITSKAELEQARHILGRSEEILIKAQLDYINKMRRRYHEEQIWQDQWRVLGTYGTWTLILLNSCVFMGSQYFQRRRERERMDTIAQLIRENKTNAMQTEGSEFFAVAEERSEIPTAVVAVEETANQNRTVTNQEEGNNVTSVKTNEEEVSTEDSIEESSATILTNGLVEAEHPERSSRERDTAEEIGQDSNYFYRAAERIGNSVALVGAAVNQWEHQVRSDAKELILSVHQQLHKALPANVAGEMPKSVSDIDVPSAIIGASVGGITAFTLSFIILSFWSRRE
mmetsp:Transcript_27514/g.59217  ORF Transcript_27514/g.59217 Transcript_27514/m.59217 type:complete len:680 (-) Transcript_27514:99-2138(-)